MKDPIAITLAVITLFAVFLITIQGSYTAGIKAAEATYNQSCWYEICAESVCNMFPLHPLLCEDLPYNCNYRGITSDTWEKQMNFRCQMENQTIQGINSTVCSCYQDQLPDKTVNF